MIETAVIVGVGIPVVVSTAAVIFLLWTGWSRSDRYCRHRRADAARLDGETGTEGES